MTDLPDDAIEAAAHAIALSWDTGSGVPIMPRLAKAGLEAALPYLAAAVRADTDERSKPKQCPRCMNWCLHDGWDWVHAHGVGIGSCPDVRADTANRIADAIKHRFVDEPILAHMADVKEAIETAAETALSFADPERPKP